MKVTVWAHREGAPALEGFYEGRDGVFEGFSTLLITVMDLWEAGEPGITIEINRDKEN